MDEQKAKPFRIEVPVYSRYGPEVCVKDGSAYVKGPAGEITWAYSGKAITGKGIFVCAVARSATKYIQQVLIKLGYDVGHEKAGTDGSVGYHLAAIQPKNCFHQVRHPLNQIASMATQSHWGFMDTFIPITNHGLLGRMELWLGWNKVCEDFCVWRYRIENFPNVWEEFLERIKHPYEPLPDVPTNTNTRKHGEVTWDNLFDCNRELAQEIRDKAEEYGYTAEPPRLGQGEAVTISDNRKT